MSRKRTISAKEIVTDIHAGLSDSELMEKYGLSAKGLESLFKKLLDSEVMKPAEIYGRMPSREDTVGVENLRRASRSYLAFPVPIYEGDHRQHEGMVIDVTESGLQVSGIDALPGETSDFVIRPEQFQDIYPVGFQAICRWARRESDGSIAAGFEITDIPEESRAELQKLIRSLTLGE